MGADERPLQEDEVVNVSRNSFHNPPGPPTGYPEDYVTLDRNVIYDFHFCGTCASG